MVKPFKNLLLWNRRGDFNETLYVALGSPAPWSDLDLFYGKVKFGKFGFSMGKSENSGIFRKLLQPVTLRELIEFMKICKY